MISIAAIEFDLDGYVEIDPLPDTDYGRYIRRATRTATLDGGAVSQDFGFTHADRTFSIRFRSTESQYALVQVSADGGVYTAIPEYQSAPDISSLNLLITEALV
jgi:hypothetical protein